MDIGSRVIRKPARRSTLADLLYVNIDVVVFLAAPTESDELAIGRESRIGLKAEETRDRSNLHRRQSWLRWATMKVEPNSDKCHHHHRARQPNTGAHYERSFTDEAPGSKP